MKKNDQKTQTATTVSEKGSSRSNFDNVDLESSVADHRDNADQASLKDLLLKLRYWYGYLLAKWAILLASIFIGCLAGLTYASYKKVIYKATTTFVLEAGDSGSSPMGQYAGIASMVGIDLGGGGGGIFQGDNIIELYKSRTMIEKTLLTEVYFNGKKQLLIDRYVEFNQLRKGWSKDPELKNIQFSSQSGRTENRIQDSIINGVVKDINKGYLAVVKPDKKLSIIKVQVTSKDEFFAKLFNENIVKNVNDFYVQTKTKKSLQNVAILQRKTDSVRAVMNGAIFTSVAIADETPNLNQTRQRQRIAPIQKSQFTAETNKAILTELVKNLEMSKISLHKETPLIQVVDQPVFPLDNERFGRGKGIILGGLIAGFSMVLLLLARLTFKEILA